MELILLIAIGYAVMVASKAAMQAWKTYSSGRRPAATGTDELPTFRVVSLGVSGTGKTVLLASMFNELVQRRPGRSYRLDASGDDRRFLAGLWTKLVDTDAGWPSGTRRGESRTFDFDFVPTGPSEQVPMFRMTYLDFAGETLESGDDPEDIEALEAHIAGAHSLFGVIDGRLLLAYLRHEPEGIRYMDGQLRTMIGYMARGRAPIHLLVTKWDLVRDIGEDSQHHESRLHIVRRALLDHRDIADLIYSDDLDGRTIRLLPISAVGDDFATLDPDGRVVKRRGARAEPYNLELPFAAVAQDYFSDLANLLTDNDAANLQANAIDRIRLPGPAAIETGLRALGAATKVALRGAMSLTGPTAMAAEPLVDVFFDWVSRPVLRKADIAAASADDEERGRTMLHATRTGVLDDFEKTIWSLEIECPSSVLRPSR